MNGAYVNVPNIGMAEWETAYWGSNFDRLRKIKAKYDPHNVFQYEQSIPPHHADLTGEPAASVVVRRERPLPSGAVHRRAPPGNAGVGLGSELPTGQQ